MITSVVCRTCVSPTAALIAAESHDCTTAEQNKGGGGAWYAIKDGKRAVFARTCLFFDEMGECRQRLNFEEELPLKY